jgi:hypothetical protein
MEMPCLLLLLVCALSGPLLGADAATPASAASPLTLDVFVPLCDSSQLRCGRRAAGDPRSLEGNLYWGAQFGAERFLSKAPGYRVVRRVDAPDPERPAVLREVLLSRAAGKGERPLALRLLAYAGDRIDDALRDFLHAAGGLPAAGSSTSADLIVWAGHDRLMDVRISGAARGPSPKPVVVLACLSQPYFGPVLEQLGARPLALTRSFMAPEAYLLEALAGAVAKRGLYDPDAVRAALIGAYAEYQHLGRKSAASVFAVLPR